MAWPDTLLPIATAITVFSMLGFAFGNYVDFAEFRRWDLPLWVGGVLALVLFIVSYCAQIHRLTAEMGSGGADNVLVSEFVGGKSLDLMVMRV